LKDETLVDGKKTQNLLVFFEKKHLTNALMFFQDNCLTQQLLKFCNSHSWDRHILLYTFVRDALRKNLNRYK